MWIRLLAASASASLATLAAALLVGYRSRRYSMVDTAWGPGFIAIALACLLIARSTGDPRRQVVLVIAVVSWAARLTWHLVERGRRSDWQDPRYAALLRGGTRLTSVRRILLPQAMAQWVVSLPLQIGMATTVSWWPAVLVGAFATVGGLLVESMADRQLRAHKLSANRHEPLDTGLWAWSRHPNYFGDACVWWGLWLIGGLASGPLWGALSMVAPLLMTLLLRSISGARLLERTLARRPDYAEYMKRVPVFVPRRPRHRRS